MKKIVLVFILPVLFFLTVNGQDTVSSVSATYQYVNTDQAMLDTLDEQLLQLEERTIIVSATLSSAINIGKVAVMVGSTAGSNDVFYKEFEFGVNDTFSDGTSYASAGNTLTIGLGKFAGTPDYYIGVIIIKPDGSMGPGLNYTME